MADWWYVLIPSILAVISIGTLVVLRRRADLPGGYDTPPPDRDFVAERETWRLGDMSAEYRAWQAASLEKDRTNRERTPPAP